MAKPDLGDWIDQQRQAGDARGNVFTDILAACARYRRSESGTHEEREVRRVKRVEGMRQQAAIEDAKVDLRAPADVQKFDQMVSRWKKGEL